MCFVPDDWAKIIFNQVAMVRFMHMLLAAYLSSAFCVAATGAWYLLRKTYRAEALIMLRMGLFLAAVLVPVATRVRASRRRLRARASARQVRGDRGALARRAAGRRGDHRNPRSGNGIQPLRDQDPGARQHHREHEHDLQGGRLDVLSRRRTGRRYSFPFLTFRVMVGCGLIMLGLAWLGSWLIIKHRIEGSRWLLRFIFLSFPLPFIATLAGWYTAEVGRQPWVVYGVLRTAHAMTPFLTAHAAATSLILFAVVYAFIFSFGIYYIYRLLRAGPAALWPQLSPDAMPNRPMSLADPKPVSHRISFRQENSHGHVLGRIAGDQHPDLSPARWLRSRRRHLVPAAEQRVAAARHAGCDRAVLGRQRDLARGDRRDPVGRLSGVYATVLSAFYIPVIFMLLGLILRGVAFEFRNKSQQSRWIWNLELRRRLARRQLHAGRDGWRARQGLADREWRIYRRDVRLVQHVFGAVRRRPLPRLCAAWRLLAGAGSAEAWFATSRAARSPLLAIGVLLFLILVFSHALLQDLPILHRWTDRPYLFVFPAIGAAAACVLASSILRHDDYWPFHMVSLIFVTAFGTLALSFWPYMVPFAITIDEAAAPHSSLAFMFWGEGLFIFPLMLLYVATGFRVFKGKFNSAPGHY